MQKTVCSSQVWSALHPPLFKEQSGAQNVSPVNSNTSHLWPLGHCFVAQGSSVKVMYTVNCCEVEHNQNIPWQYKYNNVHAHHL